MNRKTKAIIQAAVAMGYGTEADYSGASVGATLEEFAAIASEGGGGGQGGGVLIVPVNITHEGEGANQQTIYTLTKTYREIMNAGFAVFHVMEENDINIEIPAMIAQGDENFFITVLVMGEPKDYVTDSIDGYPCAKVGR
jgi:hypothetical protein